MVDTQRLRIAVSNFYQHCHLSNSGNHSAPCKAHELENIIRELTNVLNVFIDELEKNQ